MKTASLCSFAFLLTTCTLPAQLPTLSAPSQPVAPPTPAINVPPLPSVTTPSVTTPQMQTAPHTNSPSQSGQIEIPVPPQPYHSSPSTPSTHNTYVQPIAPTVSDAPGQSAPVQTYLTPQFHSYEFPQPQYYETQPWSAPVMGSSINPAGAEGVYVGPAVSGGLHTRYPYYSYRRPWYTRGPASLNVDIVW